MATSSVLYAAGKEIGSLCAPQNRDFLVCKEGKQDPADCLKQGEAVQACALNVLKSAMKECQASFQLYVACLDRQVSEEYMFERCRREETEFTQCRLEQKENKEQGEQK